MTHQAMVTDEKADREAIDSWLTDNCGVGIPYGDATDLKTMLHGLAYTLRQIEGSKTYKVNIGQHGSATSALRMALDHFATAALAQAETQPAAWQPRYKQEVIDHHRSIGSDLWEYAMSVYPTKEGAESYGYGGCEVRPLFASPVPAKREAGVVKPLEWQQSSEGYADGQWFSLSMFGEYHTYMHKPSGRAWLKGPGLEGFHDDIDAAKAAAQADYERRVLSALSTSSTPADGEGRAAPVQDLVGINTDLLNALKYVRRFLNPEDHDVSYVDDVIDKAEGRGLYAVTTEGSDNG